MAQTRNPAALGARTGPVEESLLGSFDTTPIGTVSRAKQAAIAALHRDFEAEAARLQIIASSRGAAVKFTHVADNFVMGDFEDGKRAFEAARQYGAAVTAAIKKMEAALAAEADAIIAEAFR